MAIRVLAEGKMTKIIAKPRNLTGLKPVIILSMAVVLMLKSQRITATTIENEDQSDTEATTVCPDYCTLAPDRATRFKAPFRMWYFDVSEGDCKRFRWGGRGGNKNRFRKKADCEETCSKCNFNDAIDEDGVIKKHNAETLNDAVCSHSIDEGRCPEGTQVRQPQLVWHFNKAKAKCTPFIFHGCGGNQNRFTAKDDCEETCY